MTKEDTIKASVWWLVGSILFAASTITSAGYIGLAASVCFIFGSVTCLRAALRHE